MKKDCPPFGTFRAPLKSIAWLQRALRAWFFMGVGSISCLSNLFCAARIFHVRLCVRGCSRLVFDRCTQLFWRFGPIGF